MREIYPFRNCQPVLMCSGAGTGVSMLPTSKVQALANILRCYLHTLPDLLLKINTKSVYIYYYSHFNKTKHNNFSDLFQVTCEVYKFDQSGSSFTNPVQCSLNSSSLSIRGIDSANANSSRSPSMLIQLI